MGWDRYDSPKALEAMNDLYENELSLFTNLFQPSVKLIKTVRKGSRKNRIYDRPQTPLGRLLASGYLSKKRGEDLKALRERLNPFSLFETMNQKLGRIWDLAHYRYKPTDDEKKGRSELDKHSSVEKETLETLAQALRVTVYVKARRGGELVAIHHG